MPIYILKLLMESCSSYLAQCINTAIDNCTFPESLKWAEVLPIFKNKGEADNKENYRPISILPTISKVFERIIFDQINSFMQNKFSKFLCGFRKRFSTQIALTKLIPPKYCIPPFFPILTLEWHYGQPEFPVWCTQKKHQNKTSIVHLVHSPYRDRSMPWYPQLM